MTGAESYQQERWTDDGGNKRSKIKVVVGAVQFLGKAGDSGKSDNGAAGIPVERPDDGAPF